MHVRVRLRTGSVETTSESIGDVIRLGRNPDCEIAIDPLAFPMVPGLHPQIEPAGSGFVLAHLSQCNKTLVNDSAVEGSVPVRAGDRVRLGVTDPTIELGDRADRSRGACYFRPWPSRPKRGRASIRRRPGRHKAGSRNGARPRADGLLQ